MGSPYGYLLSVHIYDYILLKDKHSLFLFYSFSNKLLLNIIVNRHCHENEKQCGHTEIFYRICR